MAHCNLNYLGAKVSQIVVANSLGQTGAQQLAAVGLIYIWISW